MIADVQLVECPRDAMQGWRTMISTSDKARYINALLKVGFHTIDFGSFVSPRIVPQMADTAEVVTKLDPSLSKLLAIVVNTRGAEEAVKFERIDVLGFPFSVSPTFQQRNANSDLEDSLKRVEEIHSICSRQGKELVVYLSMGFGNPYGDEFNQDILMHWMKKVYAIGVRTMSVSDTVGLASPTTISETLTSVIPLFPDACIGVHLHSAPYQLGDKLGAAYEAGCRRFDGAIGGIGGCPMANDELVGNVDTLAMVEYLRAKGHCQDLDMDALAFATKISREIFV